MHDGVNLQSQSAPSMLATYVPLVTGALIVKFTPISGHDDGWLDPKWWLLLAGWALLAWGTLQQLRRWRRPDAETPDA